MRLRFWLAAFLGLLLLAAPAYAREEIWGFLADVTLQTDGSVRVTETIEVNSEGEEIRRGIYRDIPVVLLNNSGQKIRSELEVVSVMRDGEDESFRTERMGNFIRVWIGNGEQLIARGKHRYLVTYTMDRVARTFADHDELYWNATGNYWIFPIVRSQAKVTLPEGAIISDLVAYSGAPGSTEQAVTATRTSNTTATFRTDRPLAAGEGMTFAVKFNKGVLLPVSGTEAALQWVSDMREIILPVLGVILVLCFNLLAWNKVGRDPPKGTIIPLFHPPKDFSPALTHYVHNWGFRGWTAFTSALFDLGVRDLVTIENRAQSLSVTATGKTPAATLPPGESKLLGYVQGKGTLRVDKNTGVEIASEHTSFKSAIEGENRKVWFNHNYGYALCSLLFALAILVAMAWFEALEPEWLILAVVGGVVLGLGATAFGSFWKGGGFQRFFALLWVAVVGVNVLGGTIEMFTQATINTAAVAAFSIVLLTVVFAVLMRAPTIQGRKIMDQIEGFKLYLDTAERERLNITGAPPMTVQRFERILPYAIALGVEKPWSDHFEGELSRNAVSDMTGGTLYRPRWYSGSTGFSPGQISSTVSAASAGMTAAMVAAQPVQASSSGFSSGGGGGGFSGGGGGGGGGGGW